MAIGSGLHGRVSDWQLRPKLTLYINELRKHGNAAKALSIAKAARHWVWEWRQKSPEFAVAHEEAVKCGIQCLADEAWRRAYEGVKRPVYQGGVRVGYVQEFSDSLLMFLMKKHDPSYRETYDVNLGNQGNKPFMLQMMLHPDGAALAAIAPPAVSDLPADPDEDPAHKGER